MEDNVFVDMPELTKEEANRIIDFVGFVADEMSFINSSRNMKEMRKKLEKSFKSMMEYAYDLQEKFDLR